MIEGLPSDFPAPRTLDARPNNPRSSSPRSWAGSRRSPRSDGCSTAPGCSLSGPGGSGKSRLALQVAAELLPDFRDGAFFADLSSVADPALVPSVVARAAGVPQVMGRPALEAVKRHLRDKQLLLVADNFEQVAEAAPMLEELLCGPGAEGDGHIRVVLSLRGEQEYLVPSLDMPNPGRLPDVHALGRFEAVRLFTERALAVQPRFRLTEENAPAVVEIISRLDGLPLAIELAATRTKVLTPQAMLPRLQQRLSILTAGARTLPERQRTLRDAIAWSYDLLEEAERRLFARLSVFAGGWTLESAEVVCDPADLGLDVLDGLASLVDKSLVRRTEPADAQPRFAMLETIREFGREQLRASGDFDGVLRRHGDHFLDLAVEAEPHLTAGDQGEWLDRCDRDHANIRVALRWAIEAGLVHRAQEAAGALWRFWQQRGHLAEGRRWLEEVLAMPSGQGPTPARAKALTGAGGIAWWQEDMAAAQVFYEEALAIERELGDPAGIAEALYNQGFILGARGDFDAAVRLFEESLELFRGAGDETGMARAEWMIVIRDLIAGDLDGTVARAEEAVATWRRVGDRFHLGDGLVWLAVLYARQAAGRTPGGPSSRPWNWSVRSTAPWGGLGHPRPGLRSQVGGAPRGRHAADRRRGVPPRAGRRRGPDQLPGGLHGRPGGRARAHLSQRPPSGPSGRAGP